MKILIISDGPFGDRAAENIRKKFPDTSLCYIEEVDRKILLDEYEFKDNVEQLIEGSDLLISYIRHPDIILELCYYNKPTIIAIFRGTGLLNQAKEINPKVVMPSSMCSLENNTGINEIDIFCEKFGKPIYKIEFNPDTFEFLKIELERESPCGATIRSIPTLIGKKINPVNLDQYAILVIHECRESVAYRMAQQEETSAAATFNHIFPLLQDLQNKKRELFAKGGILEGYLESKTEYYEQGLL